MENRVAGRLVRAAQIQMHVLVEHLVAGDPVWAGRGQIRRQVDHLKLRHSVETGSSRTIWLER